MSEQQLSAAESPALAIDDRTGSRDLRLLRQAIKQKWDIPAHLMAALPGVMGSIALDDGRGDRDRINAAKVIVSMLGQNNAEPKQTLNVTIEHPGADLLD